VCAKTVALVAALISGAYLTAAARAATDHGWVVCISLLPLFWAIRALGPVRATLAGALWGLCLYVFAATALAVITPATLSWLLLATIPAAYAGLGAALTRRIGFNPVVLGVGWILVEIALKPLGLRYGLLAGAQGEGPLLHCVGRLLGYVFVAFVVACASASLLAALSSARRLTIPRAKSSVGLPESGRGRPSAQNFLPVELWAVREGYPRGPPIRVALE
jgi:apolipoprotein N-acyltransferase